MSTCGLNFTVYDVGTGAYRCTRPAYHKGPHYDGAQQFWWGYAEPERDPATRQLWAIRRKTEAAEALKQEARRKRRKLWPLFSSSPKPYL